MCLLTREDLPVLYQLLPDDLPHDLRVDAEQLGDGGVRVVEAVQQNLRHLSLLLPYQPERIMKFAKQSIVQRSFERDILLNLPRLLLSLASATIFPLL